jgi:hypothetical protein
MYLESLWIAQNLFRVSLEHLVIVGYFDDEFRLKDESSLAPLMFSEKVQLALA